VHISLRPATPADEPFLWSMLFEAAHADEDLDGPAALRDVPELARYVEGWGRPTDLGVIAETAAPNPATRQDADAGVGHGPQGAAWVRLLTGDGAGYGWVDDDTPELAIAVAPGRRDGGVGGLLLEGVLTAARRRYPGVSLSVRADNPARRLYERAGFRPVAGSHVTNRVGGTSLTMVVRF
jgi:ribosomal protein S18 acetylase RimI-like enzyme